MPCTYHTFTPVHNTIAHTMHKRALLMRAGYVLHSHECLEYGIVGKCCSNVLRSLIAYGVVIKAVRTYVCEKSDTAHVRSSRCAIIFTQPSTRPYTPMHTPMPTYQIQTRLSRIPTYLDFSAQRNSTYHAQTCATTTHSCEQAMYCTHLSVWSMELWASAAAMCCAPSSPMELSSRLHAHMCV
jgi:hypothetical protein